MGLTYLCFLTTDRDLKDLHLCGTLTPDLALLVHLKFMYVHIKLDLFIFLVAVITISKFNSAL